MTDIEVLSIIIGVLGGVFAIIFGIANWKRTQKKDGEEDGKNGGIVLTELGYIKAGIDDLLALLDLNGAGIRANHRR